MLISGQSAGLRSFNLRPPCVATRAGSCGTIAWQAIPQIDRILDGLAFVHWAAADQSFVKSQRRRKPKVNARLCDAGCRCPEWVKRHNTSGIVCLGVARRNIGVGCVDFDNICAVGQVGEAVCTGGGSSADQNIACTIAIQIEVKRNLYIGKRCFAAILHTIAISTAAHAIIIKHRAT